MKYRNSFVSNSSSSSFVVVGFKNLKIDKEKYLRYVCSDEEVDKLIADEEDLDDIFFDVSYGCGSSPIISVNDDKNEYIGINACRSEDYGLSDYEVDIDKALEELENFKEKLGLDSSLKPKIYSGSRPS